MKLLDSGNEQEAVEIFVRAFHDDPIMNWISSHPDFLSTFYGITLPVFTPHGLSYIDARGRGAIAWLGPDTSLQWPVNPTNVWRMLKVCGARGFGRFALSGLKTGKYHPSKPHYYLFLIGTLPECKGQGIGSALMSRVLRRCDDEQMPAYLENSKEQNLAFYRGHGFEVIRQIRFAKSAPPMWLMWREPQVPIARQ